ncbi:hypothetical protein [Bosea vestrisii]|uniref:Uncharacterized protein n=1 Tax=Bosea vestrisii TaxID=151416 RepID=A0ABW0H5C5_9HYPH
MVAFLGIIFLLAFGNAIFSVLELLQTWRPGATVFQQISVRVDLGLSLLTMATSGGLAAILEQSRSQTAALASGLEKLQQAVAAPPQPPVLAVASAQPRTSAPRPPAGASVHMHRSVPYYLIDDEYVATVNGREIKASTPDLMKLRISSALNGEDSA